MKIQLMSDLHSEFYKHNKFQKFVNTLDPSETDVLILAGDIGNSKTTPDAIRQICARYKNARVLAVLGNHDLWHSDPDTVIKTHRALEIELKNYQLLNNEAVEIEGQRFLGGTMWFKETPDTIRYSRDWVDFHYIKGGSKWVYQNNSDTVEFFNKNMKKNDIIITHHLPSNQCVNSVFHGDPSNCFFVCEMDNLIKEREPKFWMFGHTHFDTDITVGNTRCICNPFGYNDHSQNSKFNKKLVLHSLISNDNY